MKKTNPKQETITDNERLELRLAISEHDRIDAQLKLLQSQFQLLSPTLSPAKQKIEKLETAMKTKYGIKNNDTVDIESGVITRGPVSELEENDEK